MHNSFTLSVNLSPGDVKYAEITAAKLAEHHTIIPNRLLVVDCCKPQKTKLVNPAIRFPEPYFTERCEEIINISHSLIKNGYYNQLFILKPNSPIFKHLSKKYLNNVIKSTHGAGGTAQMAYWAGIELANTRYVLHYDGDIILHQKKDYFWWLEAVEAMSQNEKAIFAIPRHAPPSVNTKGMPTLSEGTEIIEYDSFWLHNWFSTRFFLLDKVRLTPFLPLVSGKLLFELLVRKYLMRSFPLDPEIILFRTLGQSKGMRRLILKSENAWALHPHSKPVEFIDMIKDIYDSVHAGRYPIEQGGLEELNLKAWSSFIKI